MRLIDADELIPSLKMGEVNADTAYGDGRNGGIYFAIWRIGQMPTVEPKQRWIPCNWRTKEENLPQECKSVLICMKDGCGYRIGVSYRTDYNRWEGYGRVNVIAWMPLPEPYREYGEADGDG